MAVAHASDVVVGPTLTRPRLRLVQPPNRHLAPPDHAPAPVAIPGQQAFDLTYLLPGGLPAVPEIDPDLLLPAPRRCPPEVVADAGQPTDRAELPPAGPWAARLAQACLEVCTAGRPVNQLARWTTPTVFDELTTRYVPMARRASDRRRAGTTEKVRSVHVCEPANGVVEASAVIAGGTRPRALALRLEGWRGRWICTALEWV